MTDTQRGHCLRVVGCRFRFGLRGNLSKHGKVDDDQPRVWTSCARLFVRGTCGGQINQLVVMRNKLSLRVSGTAIPISLVVHRRASAGTDHLPPIAVIILENLCRDTTDQIARNKISTRAILQGFVAVSEVDNLTTAERIGIERREYRPFQFTGGHIGGNISRDGIRSTADIFESGKRDRQRTKASPSRCSQVPRIDAINSRVS
ncbi:hypothetical protein [Labrenzia phage vB_LagS-V1]